MVRMGLLSRDRSRVSQDVALRAGTDPVRLNRSRADYRRLHLAIVVLTAICVGGASCGAPRERSSPGSAPQPATIVRADGEYRIGVDLVPGVYTSTASRDCNAFVASTPHFNINTGDYASFIGTSTEYDGVERIVLPKGAYLTTLRCSVWRRESARTARTYDPATLSGGCAILIRGGILGHAERILRGPAASVGRDDVQTIQSQLFDIVAAKNQALAGPVGIVIDALDALDSLGAAGSEPITTRALATIRAVREICGRS